MVNHGARMPWVTPLKTNLKTSTLAFVDNEVGLSVGVLSTNSAYTASIAPFTFVEGGDAFVSAHLGN
ncbi:hypothetical protein SCLCIDRAFT_1207781 [Scleroderma citrinum Foug A]|uniref:Uncharacterized protein n=1 Tax=Scleroderma citrinum Foug A TaxID=1036808 RepID=A0A0C3E9F4_9AGAM|nr:hypothetical protein SCLCIDRAFT_1207781 [Scleroderma citrinum Foug A]